MGWTTDSGPGTVCKIVESLPLIVRSEVLCSHNDPEGESNHWQETERTIPKEGR